MVISADIFANIAIFVEFSWEFDNKQCYFRLVTGYLSQFHASYGSSVLHMEMF